MNMQTIKVGNDTYVYDPSKVQIQVNGMRITGWVVDEWVDFSIPHYKFKPRSSRQEMFIKDNEDGRKIFRDVSCALDKYIDTVPSKDGWLRIRPAFNVKEMEVIKNYLKMVEGV